MAQEKQPKRYIGFLANRLLLTLKLLMILALVNCSMVFATGYAQQVTLNAKDMSLATAMQSIQKQSGYGYFFNGRDLANLKVHAKISGLSVDRAMTEMLKDAPAEWVLKDNIIVIRPAPPKSTSSFPKEVEVKELTQQQKEITGKVTDASGNPLAGVSVTVKGTQTGTATNAEGVYSFSVADDAAILEFSMVGFETVEKPIGANTVIDAVLTLTQSDMQEVVVVGYGTQKKANLTAAATVVDKELLENRPAANVSSLLQGTVPNLQVTFSSGRPGESGSFNIRGINSISSKASPLVIIDGFEGDINRINPNDVESVTVLKDASAAAVYGARASYGVILVTTKKGSKARASITYSGQASISESTTSTDYETRGYYSAAINDLFFSNYAGTPYTLYNENDYYELWIRRNDKTEHPERPWVTIQNRDGRDSYVYYANTDWYNYLFDDTRPMQSHNISISGSSENMRYSLSGNYFDQDGIFRNNTDNLRRYNLRSKVDFEVTDWLDVNTNLSYFNSTYAYPGPGGVKNTFNSMVVHGLASIVPVNPDGTYVYNTTISNYSVMDGYAAMLSQGLHRNEDKISEFSPTIEAVIKPMKGLDVRASYRFIHYNSQAKNRSVNIPYSKYPGEVETISSGIGNNRLYEVQTNHQYQAVNTYATYETKFLEDHDLKLMAGINYETKYLKDIKAARDGLLSNYLDDFETAVGEVMEINGGQNEYALFGTFYRLNYAYKDKYLFEAAGRYDGTSRFAKDHRFGFFPSFSAGWRIDREGFWQNLDQHTISGLKLRASYGSLGNQQVGYYDYLQTISAGGTLDYTFGDGALASYAKESAPNSSSLTWETVNTTNLGLDVELFQNRLSFTGDIYRRETLDMLTAGKAIPAYYGAAVPKENASDLLTKGWEVSVNWRDRGTVAGKTFNYYLSAGVGDNISKITRFDNPNKNLENFYVGQTLGDIWGYVVNGYFKTDKEAAEYPVDQRSVNNIINTSAIDQGLHAGDLKFEDLDGDKVISRGENTLENPGDRKIIGNSLPRYNFTFNASANWNNFDVSVFVQGIGRQHWYPDPNAIGFWGTYSRPYATFLPKDFLSKVWSEENPNAYFPRPRGYIALNASNRSLGVPSTKYLQDLAYVRLKNVTLGYTLPESLTAKAGLTRVRFYFSGENLLTLTKLESRYIDPEQAAAENTYEKFSSRARTYPWAKTYLIGLNVSL